MNYGLYFPPVWNLLFVQPKLMFKNLKNTDPTSIYPRIHSWDARDTLTPWHQFVTIWPSQVNLFQVFRWAESDQGSRLTGDCKGLPVVHCTVYTRHCTLLYTVHQLVSREGLVIINHKSGNWGHGHDTHGHTVSDTHGHILTPCDTHGHTVSDTHGHTVAHCDT